MHLAIFLSQILNCRSARDSLTKEFDEHYDEYERTFSIDNGVDEDEAATCELGEIPCIL